MTPKYRDGRDTGALCPPVRRPDAMSADQRIGELGAILARAYHRLAALKDGLDSIGVSGLHEPVDVKENREGTEAHEINRR